MNQTQKNVSLLLLLSVLLLGSIAGYQRHHFYDGKLHVIFCSVGQGDAILIQSPDHKYLMVDSGPDRTVLDCLARHMPFWQRQINLMILTHPHADHFFGLFYLLKQYQIEEFATEALRNDTSSFTEVMRLLSSKKVPQRYVLNGDNWWVGQVRLEVMYPTQEYLDNASPNGLIGETKELASVMTNISYGNFDILLTGDSQTEAMKQALAYLPGEIDVLQSPHHGSQTGVDAEVVAAIHPQLAVISVGAHNRYGHPHKKVLQIYQDQNIPVLRTDQHGDIEIVSDGNGWEVKK